MRPCIKYRPQKQQRCAATIEDGFKGNWGNTPTPSNAALRQRLSHRSDGFSENRFYVFAYFPKSKLKIFL